MKKTTIIGIILILTVVIGFYFFFISAEIYQKTYTITFADSNANNNKMHLPDDFVTVNVDDVLDESQESKINAIWVLDYDTGNWGMYSPSQHSGSFTTFEADTTYSFNIIEEVTLSFTWNSTDSRTVQHRFEYLLDTSIPHIENGFILPEGFPGVSIEEALYDNCFMEYDGTHSNYIDNIWWCRDLSDPSFPTDCDSWMWITDEDFVFQADEWYTIDPSIVGDGKLLVFDWYECG